MKKKKIENENKNNQIFKKLNICIPKEEKKRIKEKKRKNIRLHVQHIPTIFIICLYMQSLRYLESKWIDDKSV